MSQVDQREFIEIFTTPDAIDRERYICVHYRFVPCKGLSLEQAAGKVATITALRTLAPMPYESRNERLKHAGYVLSVQDSGQVIIGYPIDICSPSEGLTQLLLTISAGAEYDYTAEYWVDQIDLPKSFLERFRGPKFGIEGIRNRFKIPTRPLIGVIVKPRWGVPLSKIAEQCREGLLGGADFLADDILMTDPEGELALKNRVPVLAKITREASSKTGEHKWYAVNIGASPKRAMEYAKFAQAEGCGALIVNAFTMGFSTIEEMTNEPDIDLPFITTNMGMGIITRPGLLTTGSRQSSGISEGVISKLSRLAGADAAHVGTIDTGCYAQEAWHPSLVGLRAKLHKIRPAFTVGEGDLTIVNVWENIHIFGPDVMLETCTGILGYPGGPLKGAQAFRTIVKNVTFDMNADEAHAKIMDLAQHDSNIRQGLQHYRYSPKNTH
jgi:ribulose 1,5-bisphosphate carboxylase large subunit-like protein